MASSGASRGNDRLFTRNFLLVCGSTLTFFGSFYLQLPVLPLWVLTIGGNEADVGLAVGAFSITALLLRPLVGREIDRWGRKPFFVAGALVFFLSALLYPLATSVPVLCCFASSMGLA